jgi:drug/metabolite transporter (DMT)-like permease
VLRSRGVSRSRVVVTLLVVQAMFGTLPLTGQTVLRWIPPIGAASLRAVGAALVFALVAGRRLAAVRLRDLPQLVLFAFLAIIGNQLLFLEGLSRTTQINAAVLITTIPVFTVAFALALRRERASGLKLAGIAVGLTGALLLARIEQFRLADREVVGDLLVIANCSLWSLYLVLARPVLQRIPPLVLTAWLFLLGALVTAPLGLPSAIDGLADAPPEVWAAAAWMVVGPTIVAYLLNFQALRDAESSQVAVFTYLQPVVAGALAWGVADETLRPRTLAAAALIFAGVALVQRAATRAPAARTGNAPG